MIRPYRDHLTDFVEIDKTYVAGVEEKIHGRGAERKVIVAIAAEVRRKGPGRIRTSIIPDESATNLHEFILKLDT